MLPLPAPWRRQVLHLRLLWLAGPRLAVACLILAILQPASAVAAMICSGRLIGAVASALAGTDDAAGPTRWLAATAVTFVAGPLFAAISRGLEELLNARYLSAYQDLLLDTATHPHGVADLQSPNGAQALDQAADALQDWLFLRGLNSIWGVIAARLAGVGSLVIVMGWRWWVALVLMIGWLFLSRATAQWRSIIFDDTMGDAMPLRHRASYIHRVVAGRPSAKEIRLFGLADWFVNTHVDLMAQAMAVVTRRRGEGLRRTIPALGALLLLHAGAFALLTRDASSGAVSVATLATLVQALLGLSAFGRQDDDETSLGRVTTVLARLVRFRESLGLPFPAAPPAPAPPRSHSQPVGLEVTNVTFRYPGGDHPVLEDLDLVVEPGECVAIVGANGAGKSTLLALLSGLWTPEAGTIRVGARDPGSEREARSQIAPIFQHFIRFPLPAAENITVGNAWRPETSWHQPASDAGADTVLAELSHGEATVLSAEFADGTDLSGGQWQRIALARALTAIESGAGILALDEPTAALDVRAEVALFDSVLRRRGGVTTLLITHRLSSVRHADRIVVLGSPAESSGARVIESGTHDQLLRAGGTYAHMFQLQASRFRRETP